MIGWQIFKLAKTDLVKTYSGASLGWTWAVLRPTITILVYWFAFAIGLRQGGLKYGYPFVLWMIPGFIAWFFMSDMITQGANSIRKYRFLVTKMKFPVAIIPSFVGLSKLFVHMALLVLTLFIFYLNGYHLDIFYLQLPIYMFFMFITFVSVAQSTSVLSSISLDFFNLVNATLMAVFWLSGVIWDASTINIRWVRVLMYFNPVNFIAKGYRNVFIHKIWIWEEPVQMICFLITLLLINIIAVNVVSAYEKELPDYL